MKDKAMSDGEVNDFVFKKLMGDMDPIEASGMFADEAPQDAKPEGVKMEAGGYSVHIKPMDGQQTKDIPKMEKDTDEEEDMKLGM